MDFIREDSHDLEELKIEYEREKRLGHTLEAGNLSRLICKIEQNYEDGKQELIDMHNNFIENGNILIEASNIEMNNCEDNIFLYEQANAENYEMKTDWAENIITILDIYSSKYKIEAFEEFNSSTLIELITDTLSNINYEVTDVHIDGDNASATVKMKSTDFPALILATANEVQKDTKKSDNLGITPDYSELFKKHIKKVELDYINKISETFEFNLVKEAGKWKIDEINDRNVFLETLTLNLIEFN